jgi:hypothetical protein
MQANVTDVRARELPLAGFSFLRERDDLQIMSTRQASEQRHERRDYPVLSRSIDASRYHQSDSHCAA